MNRVSDTDLSPSSLIAERLHLLEVELVSENLIASFPFHGFVAYFDFPPALAIAPEHLAVRHGVWLPLYSKLVSARTSASDVKPHARREWLENRLESSLEIVDRSL
jgi:hypothetical protein